MAASPRVVIIGAGIVGGTQAHELTQTAAIHALIDAGLNALSPEAEKPVTNGTASRWSL